MNRTGEKKPYGKTTEERNQSSEMEETLILFYRRCHSQTQKAILDFVIRMAREEGR